LLSKALTLNTTVYKESAIQVKSSILHNLTSNLLPLFQLTQIYFAQCGLLAGERTCFAAEMFCGADAQTWKIQYIGHAQAVLSWR